MEFPHLGPSVPTIPSETSPHLSVLMHMLRDAHRPSLVYRTTLACKPAGVASLGHTERLWPVGPSSPPRRSHRRQSFHFQGKCDDGDE